MWDKRVEQELRGAPLAGPVVVMVHGFLFNPKERVFADPPANANPHGRVYHFQQRAEDEEIREHTTGWPLGLGFAADDSGAAGLAVAFGWHSAPGLAGSLLLHGQNHYARAYDYAGKSAWVLANVLVALAAHPALAGRPIDLFCHSLGSRVVIRAIALMADRLTAAISRPMVDHPEPDRLAAEPALGRLGRVILLGGAEYVVEAQLMLRRLIALGLPAGTAFYNVISRENQVLDLLAENFGPRTFGNSQVVGHDGLGGRASNPAWIDLAIDSSALRLWMQVKRGQDVSGDQPGNVWDHWYYFTYRGNMRAYAAILRDRSAWELGRLRLDGVPEGVPD